MKKGPFKKPLKEGALHRELGIAEGKKIPANRLTVHSGDSKLLKQRKRLAKTMRKWNKG